MALITSKILLSFGLKIFIPIFKILRSKLEKELYIYTILRNKNAITLKSDFESIYIETLYQLISIKNKNKAIVKLFELDEVKEAFKNEIYQNNDWSFQVSADSNLHTNPSLRQLKSIDINIETEIQEFKKEFKKAINLTRKPKEIEDFETLNKLTNGVNDLISTQELNKKLKTEVEINNQIIFSKSEIQPISDHISKRKELVNSILINFKSASWTAINGSISTGKSQLSVLLSQKLDNPKYWINLRELESSNFVFKIYSDLSSYLSIPSEINLESWKSNIFEQIEEQAIIILDNLPLLNIRNQSFEKFISFINACKEKKIRILSTSNFTLPTKIKDSFNPSDIYEITIPVLNINEVFEVIQSYNVNDQRSNQLKTIIQSISTGHPVIVKAICKYLEKTNWILSDAELSNIFSGSYSSEINEDTYRVLIETILDENTRNLLYRLNIIIGQFTQDDVRIIGNNAPEITNVIEKFNTSIGIWIQKINESNYEVSPLLKRLRSKNLNPELERNISYSLGKSILDKGKLNQLKALKAISYFVTANAYNDAGFVLILVLKEAVNNPKSFFEWGFHLYWENTPLPKKMDIVLQLYIRSLQILIHMQENIGIEYLIEDLEQICTVATKKEINFAPAYLLLSNHYAITSPSKALQYLMIGNNQYDKLVQEINDPNVLTDYFKDFDSMIWVSVIGIKTIDNALSWFETITKLSKNQILSIKESENIDFGSIVIFKNLYELEENKPIENQNWNNLINSFKLIQEEARTLDLVLICANAIRYIINIYGDKLNDIDSAIDYSRAYLEDKFSNQSAQFLIYDAIGKQLFYHSKTNDAKIYITKAIEIEVNSFYTEKLDTCLVMSQILSKTDTKTALHFTKEAYIFAKENKNISDIGRAKTIGELAISLFFNDDIVEAIYELAKGYQILLDSYSIDFDNHNLILKYGHILNYFTNILFTGIPPEKDCDGGPYFAPQRGMFARNSSEDLVEEYFFPERRFMVSYLFFKFFEDSNDFISAKKWAYNNISINNDFDFNYFNLLNTCTIPYLIVDQKYVDAINLQISTIDTTNQLNHDETKHEIFPKNKHLQNIIESRPKHGIKEYDEPLIEAVVLPIILNYITTHSRNNEDLENNNNKLDDVLLTLKQYMQDISFIESIEKIIHETSTETNSVNNVLQIIDGYKGAFYAALKMIGYLLSSISSSNIESLKLHFSVVYRLDTNIKIISKSTYNIILIPFFEQFWFNRIANERLSDMEFWNKKSVPFYEKTNAENKIKCLFKILAHHLNYETSNIEDEWLDY
ncbi:MAG: hypothetical protein PHW82_12055 [Bacteroidales bacterium]|nr:hypothetical protein [Bacteroidales bacterium]